MTDRQHSAQQRIDVVADVIAADPAALGAALVQAGLRWPNAAVVVAARLALEDLDARLNRRRALRETARNVRGHEREFSQGRPSFDELQEIRGLRRDDNTGRWRAAS
jgi:hypothetical protein